MNILKEGATLAVLAALVWAITVYGAVIFTVLR